MNGYAQIIPATNRQHAIDALARFLLAATPNKALDVVVKPHTRKRSRAQNDYLWGVCYELLKEATGNEPDDLHEYFLGECFGWKETVVMEKRKLRPARRSSDLSTTEFQDFIAFIQRRSAETVGVYIPDPNEPDYSDF